MNPLIAWGVSLVTGGAAGVIGGVIVNWRLDRDRYDDEVDEAEIDPVLDERIDAAAREWSRREGRPGTEHLVAGKLRLAARLQQRRVNRRYEP